jgi:GAF domain-containing protein
MDSTQLPAYKNIISAVADILDEDQNRDEKLLAICNLLSEEIDTFDWVGFYLADPQGKEELVLGPFVGPSTDHTRIPFGRGICGQVAVSHETFVSQDVNSEENYLSCSATVQSEIVVPIMKDGDFVAQLDIDSNTKASITKAQQNLIEEICDMLSGEF